MTLIQKLFFLALFLQICFYPVVLLIMFRARVAAVKAKKIPFKYFATYSSSDEIKLPENLIILSNHYNNLFQSPLLFIATGAVAFSLNMIDLYLCLLAWLFVILRFIHSYIHLGSNNIIHRLRVFGSSNMVLLLIWMLMLGKICLS